jgi:hypothetical protein
MTQEDDGIIDGVGADKRPVTMNNQPTTEDVKRQLGIGPNSHLKKGARRLLWAAGLLAVLAAGFYFYESR